MKNRFLTYIFARIKRARTRKAKPLMRRKHDVAILRKVHGKSLPSWRQVRHLGKVLSPRERTTLRVAIGALIIGLLWGGTSLTNSYRTQVPAVGGTYTEAVVGTPQLINPLFANVNDVDRDLVKLVYSGLMHYDANQRLMPDLAESFTISEDKKTYTFTLREDVTWHDGEPFSARDVAFTFDLIQDPQVGSPLQVSFQGVDVDIVDERTIAFILDEPFQPFLASLTVGILPEHIWINIPYEQMKLAKQNVQPIGTGPYAFSKLAKDDTGFIFRYELARNAGYYNQPPHIETFAFQFFGDFETDLGAIHALRQQKVDGLHFVPSHLRSQVERKHIVLHTLQLPQYTALFFNQKKQPHLEEEDFRTALAYALDKDRILRESLAGDGRVIYSPVLPGFPGFQDNVEKTPYSTDQANELLDDVFVRVSSEDFRAARKEEIVNELLQQYRDTATSTEEGGIDITSSTEQIIDQAAEAQLDDTLNDAQLFYRQTDEEENPETIELNLVTADTEEYRSAAGLIAGFWQELGITTNIEYVSPRDISREVLRNRDYDVLLYGIIIGSDPDQYPFWHSSQTAFPGLNLAQYVNRSVDDLLEKARETDSETEAADLFGQFQDKVLEDRPAVFLHTPIYRYATTDRINGIGVERIFHPSDRFANVTEWYIKTKGEWNFSR